MMFAAATYKYLKPSSIVISESQLMRWMIQQSALCTKHTTAVTPLESRNMGLYPEEQTPHKAAQWHEAHHIAQGSPIS